MFSFTKEVYNLDEALRYAGMPVELYPSHIEYSPDMIPQYRIRRGSAHDGTLMFSMEVMRNALWPLISRGTYYKPFGVPPPGMDIHYTVGRIWRICVFLPEVDPLRTWRRMRERVVIPVSCHYVANPEVGLFTAQ